MASTGAVGRELPRRRRRSAPFLLLLDVSQAASGQQFRPVTWPRARLSSVPVTSLVAPCGYREKFFVPNVVVVVVAEVVGGDAVVREVELLPCRHRDLVRADVVPVPLSIVTPLGFCLRSSVVERAVVPVDGALFELSLDDDVVLVAERPLYRAAALLMCDDVAGTVRRRSSYPVPVSRR